MEVQTVAKASFAPVSSTYEPAIPSELCTPLGTDLPLQGRSYGFLSLELALWALDLGSHTRLHIYRVLHLHLCSAVLNF